MSTSITQEAFGDIVRRYQNLVAAVTYSITGNRQESEDLAQETFIAAWQGWSELRDIDKLPGWLCGIARNLANNWVRKTQLERQSRCVQFLGESAIEEIPATIVQDESESEERIALLWATLKEIPMQFREPLVMYYQQNQSVVDIASALELSEDNVRQRIARGRAYLKKKVERQVETTLFKIRPSEHFTVAVLAALPIALTGEQVLAAGTAGAAASQSASASGASAGASVFTGIAAFFTTLLHTLYCITFYGLGIALGVWSGIRNAPTLRARQFMVKVTLGYTIALSLYVAYMQVFFFLIVHIFNEGYWGNYVSVAYIFSFAILPISVPIASYLINRKWRKIVEEDVAQQNPLNQVATSKVFLRSTYRLVGIALFFVWLASVAQTTYLASIESMSSYSLVANCLSAGIIILTIGLSFFYYAVKISKNQEAFEKYPPRLPNLLSILTGEEKAPGGLRNRINFWGDVWGIGWVVFILHMVPLGMLFVGNGGDNVLLFVSLLVFLVYFLFVLFFAGIPRRRYWGMIVFGLSALLICSVAYYSSIFEAVYRDRAPVLLMYVLSAMYLLCFMLVGVAGLRVFRRNK